MDFVIEMKAGLAVVKVGLQRPPREDGEVLRALQGLVTSCNDRRFRILGELNFDRAVVQGFKNLVFRV